MIALTLAEIADLTGGHLSAAADPHARVTGPVVHDSRAVQPGGLFAAIKGSRVDGHDLAASAIEAGAVAVAASRPVEAPAVLVPDVTTALGMLARHVLSRLPELTVVALTGSVGKTSVKDLLGQVLAHAGETISPVGSFNNELGLPLTVLRATESTRFLVLEMGARHSGDIAELTRIAPPQVGMVLNVRTAHIGEFGSQQAIADAKSEIVQALPPAGEGGIAVLNADDPYVAAMADMTSAAIVTFGQHDPTPHVHAAEVTTEQGRAGFTLHTPTGQGHVRLKAIGRHQVDNALAAAAAAHAIGMTAQQIAAALTNAEQISAGRMQVLHRERDDILIVNDAFNASPDSAHAGLTAFADLAGDRRTVAVLGEMRELGDTAAVEHRRVGELVRQLGIDVLVTVGGGDTDHIAAAAGASDLHRTAVSDLHTVLGDVLQSGDAVYIKAARSVGLEHFADELVK